MPRKSNGSGGGDNHSRHNDSPPKNLRRAVHRLVCECDVADRVRGEDPHETARKTIRGHVASGLAELGFSPDHVKLVDEKLPEIIEVKIPPHSLAASTTRFPLDITVRDLKRHIPPSQPLPAG
ncbi:hypothetical protein A2V68_00880 [candidate division Kazan bacterium RBG_13_50_9]|uniref:Uncharacterized protein n=1 Tax=candidate division Kazan bacterium RBG_13_50_9 TaxID=1798535 RepID=A0A1F4NSA6_UNCK3|nr:MAG: hypothetical protein A2V68_00880 [candidate division Kazan bacterium RBG_13_50_9]